MSATEVSAVTPAETPAAPNNVETTAETVAENQKQDKVVVKNVSNNVHKVDFEKDVVYLYQFGRCPAMPQLSPFCFKVETWLRMVGLKYEVVDHHLKFKSKKGQLPFVEVNGEEVADSQIIINKLSKLYEKNMDESLSVEQKVLSHALISMLNNHTSWVMRWFRFHRPDEFRKASKFDIKKETNSKLPKGLLNFVFRMNFKNNVKTTVNHGLGHHTEQEIIEFGKNDLKSLSDYLGEKDFFFGENPSLLDCEVFAHVSQFWYIPVEQSFKDYIENECSNLVTFLNRMKEKYWSDWEELCKVPEPAPPKKAKKPVAPAVEEEVKETDEKNETEKEKSDEKENEEKEKTEENEKETEKEKETEPENKEKEEPAKEAVETNAEDNKEKEESK